jgi:hypothetical protein
MYMSPAHPGQMTVCRPDELHTYYRNARRGDIDVIMGSLRAHSQYRPLVGNIGTHTGRPNEVLAGNHTLLAIRKLAETYPMDPRWSEVKVFWGDWNEEQCTKIVLADNRTAEVGGMDFAALKDLLDSLPDREGTGFSDTDYSALAASLTAPSLDDLAAEYGDGVTADDLLERLSLKVTPEAQREWSQLRSGYTSDSEAMRYLLGMDA